MSKYCSEKVLLYFIPCIYLKALVCNNINNVENKFLHSRLDETILH